MLPSDEHDLCCHAHDDPTPYVSSEFFYQSQYHKFSTTALYAGCLLPAGKHAEFDPYYDNQNITGKRPNQQLNQFGLVLDIYFQARRQVR
ncbi:MAG TPA: hypothetical protein VMT20_13220 [Terriglobia bacterium]|nr:hypothetical protein [Terriglobia bacterium]